jgi:uncharacterized protein (TIGR02118 family)
VSLVRRRQDMSRPEFADYWLGPHADIARRIPGIRGYVINLFDDPAQSGWDGMAETWFESREDADYAFGTGPVAAELAADRPKFLDTVVIVMVEEHEVVRPAGRTGTGGPE